MAMAQDRFVFARNRTSWSALKAFWKGPQRKRAYLDVRSLPEHLQRDIGILDGNHIIRKSLERCGE